MWIAAHPDDEAVAAPLLSKWCREQNAQCTFVIMTRGEAGGCLLPNGCEPDIATVRSAEAGAASQLFGATLVHLIYRDGGGVLPPEWGVSSVGVTGVIAGLIDTFHPELILTFDPRHGTTCHPDHRATGELVLEAVRHISYTPAMYLLETRVAFEPFAIRFSSATPDALRYDATTTWDAIALDMRRHPSQFDDATIAGIASVPVSERAVFFGTADEMLRETVATCP
jgi:LmbE family N-acetylglucosaminyl deacetylase